MKREVQRKLLVTLLFCTGWILAAFKQKPNLILIDTDDRGYGNLSLHGHQIITTPNLDRLAGSGYISPEEYLGKQR